MTWGRTIVLAGKALRLNSDIYKIKIAIDPRLKEVSGPEICWVWRLLLSGLGYAWEEVSVTAADCDIIYGLDTHPQGPCRVYVQGNVEKWKKKSEWRLGTIGEFEKMYFPIYDTELGNGSRLFRAADGCVTCQTDIIFDIFWLATGQEERYWQKNQHGHFDLSGTVFDQKKVGRLAVATSIGCWLEKTLRSLGCPAGVPRWPNGKRAALCIGHDVDYPEVIKWLEPLRIMRRQGLRAYPAAVSVVSGIRTHWHFSSWVQLEKAFNTRSAFYFVARRGSFFEYALGTPDPFYDIHSARFRALFRYLSEEGFEIGLHASYRAFESRERFASEKEVLSTASGQEICGNRHHYWHLHPDDPESTLLMHEQIGLKYDATLAHERYVGWRRGLSWPFFPFHQKQRRELKTLQISTTWMDDQLFGHRQDNPGERLEILQTLADTAADQGGCLQIDIHDYVFDETLFPDWAKTYNDLLEHIMTRSDFWVETPGQIANHWSARCAFITKASKGLIGIFG